MNILALETCAEQGSIALLIDDGICETRLLPAGWNSSTIHGEIVRLLECHGVTTKEMDGFAVSNGPGSFTGVRVGLGVAKALAEVHQKPVLAVSTLQAIAASAYSSLEAPKQALFVPILDARRGQVFSTVLRIDLEEWTNVTGESVLTLISVLDLLPSIVGRGSRDHVVFCGVDLRPYSETIEESAWKSSIRVETSPMLAGVVAKLALKLLREGKGCSSDAADANYVRRSDAELFWKEA